MSISKGSHPGQVREKIGLRRWLGRVGVLVALAIVLLAVASIIREVVVSSLPEGPLRLAEISASGAGVLVASGLLLALGALWGGMAIWAIRIRGRDT
jgi:hypothetical protein